MKKIIFSTFLLTFALSSISSASEDSQATFGDIKEAVYKLILINKKRDKIDEVLKHTRKDAYDNYINAYVSKNKKILVAIKQGE